MKVSNLRKAESYTLRCDRAGILGNPCSIPNVSCPECGKIHFGSGMKQLDKTRSIPCYRAYLWKEIQKKSKVYEALISIKETDILACWCIALSEEEIFAKEEVCHTQVLWKAWVYLKGE